MTSHASGGRHTPRTRLSGHGKFITHELYDAHRGVSAQADPHALALKFEETLRRVFLTRSMDFVNDDVLTTVQPVNFV